MLARRLFSHARVPPIVPVIRQAQRAGASVEAIHRSNSHLLAVGGVRPLSTGEEHPVFQLRDSQGTWAPLRHVIYTDLKNSYFKYHLLIWGFYGIVIVGCGYDL